MPYIKKTAERPGRSTEDDLRKLAREMHLEEPEVSEEEFFEGLQFTSVFPTLEDRISIVWRDVRLFRRPKDTAELKRLLAKRREIRARNRH